MGEKPEHIYRFSASGSNRPSARQPPRKQRSPKVAPASSTASILAAVNPFTSPSHTDAKDSSLNVPSRLTADRDVGHDLPPGCRVANTLLSRQPAQSSSRSERGLNFQAFSGTGFSLGSGASGLNPRKTSKPTATVTSEKQIPLLDNRARGEIARTVLPIDGLEGRNVHQIGQSGDNFRQNYNINCAIDRDDNNVSGYVEIPRNRHVSRSGDGTDNVGNRLLASGDNDRVGSLGYSGIDNGDFADPQNEKQIFQEVSRNARKRV